MKKLRIRGLTPALVVLFLAPLAGQWLHYPTPNVPRTASGAANLAARAPRLPDGKPDFSGIWQSARKLPCTPEVSKFVDCGLEIGGSPLALNIGGDLAGCRISRGQRRSSNSGPRTTARTTRMYAACPTTRLVRTACRT